MRTLTWGRSTEHRHLGQGEQTIHDAQASADVNITCRIRHVGAPTSMTVQPIRLLILVGSDCRATTAFASRIARPSSPVRSKLSLATFAQSCFSSGVVALWVCLSASFAVHGI